MRTVKSYVVRFVTATRRKRSSAIKHASRVAMCGGAHTPSRVKGILSGADKFGLLSNLAA